MILTMERSVESLLVAYHRDGDEQAREQVLVELMPLVRALAARYAGRGEALEDLVQVGSIGLIKAVDRFDIDRGVDISSYAVPTIVGEIRRHFRDKAWAMHVPRRLKELSVRLSRVLDQLTNELGRSPTIAELAAGGRGGGRGCDRRARLDQRLLDTIAPGAVRGRWRRLSRGQARNRRHRLRRGRGRRTRRGRASPRWTSASGRIVELRFFEEMTQSQIAAEIGISQMHVSRLLRRALATMRGRIAEVSTDD